MFAFATKRICRSPQRICRDAQCSPESDLCPAWRWLFTRVGRTAFSASSLFLVVEKGLVERRKIAPDLRPSPRYDGRDSLKAIPLEGIVGIALLAPGFDHQSDRAGRLGARLRLFIALRKFVRSVTRRKARARNHIRPS